MMRRFAPPLALVLGGCAEPPCTHINIARLKALRDQGVPIYDIRRPEEWRQTGVVRDSRKLAFVNARGRPNPEFLPRFAAEVGKDDPVILICRTGSRTDVLARHPVERMGYTPVYNVRHGIARWIREGKPVFMHRMPVTAMTDVAYSVALRALTPIRVMPGSRP